MVLALPAHGCPLAMREARQPHSIYEWSPARYEHNSGMHTLGDP